MQKVIEKSIWQISILQTFQLRTMLGMLGGL